MKTPKDMTLATLANRAGCYLQFDDDAAGSQSARLRDLANRRIAYRGVTQVGSFWIVRLTLSGQQITIGRFESRFPLNAVRYADCAMSHFWKYRSNPRALDDSDLTLGIALIANAPLAVGALLTDIEEHLKSSRFLDESTATDHSIARDPILSHRRMLRAWKVFLKSLDVLHPTDAACITEAADKFETEIINKIQF